MLTVNGVSEFCGAAYVRFLLAEIRMRMPVGNADNLIAGYGG